MASKAFEIYSKLPVFTGPNMLPPANMTKYTEQIRRIMDYCKVIFMPKLKPWCEYVKDLENEKKDQVKEKTPSIACNMSNLLRGSDERSICHDAYFCHSESTAQLVHILSIISLLIAILAIVSNLIFLPAIRKLSKKTTYPLFMMTAVLSGGVYLILGSFISLYPVLRNNHTDQQQLYSRHIAYLSLFLSPASDACLSLCVWMFCLMVIDRYWFTTNVTNYKPLQVKNCKQTMKHVVRIFALFALFLVCATFKILRHEYSSENTTGGNSNVKVVKSKRIFKNLKDKHFELLCDWFRLTFELVTPCVLLAVFSALIQTHRSWNRRKHLEEGGNSSSQTPSFDTEKGELVIEKCRIGESTHQRQLNQIVVMNSSILSAIQAIRFFIYLGNKALITKFPDISALMSIGDFTISSLGLLIICLVSISIDKQVKRYILHGWLCSDTPPPQGINDLPYTKCKDSPIISSNSRESV